LKVEIFIPCFNEEKNIALLVSSWANVINSTKGYRIFITFIDNGSDDLTNKELSKNIELSGCEELKKITKNENNGYGSGIMFGVRESNADLVGWAHADLQFNPSEVIENLNKIIEKTNGNKEILIIGERTNRGTVDVLFTKAMSIIVWLFTKIYLHDINSQPKIFSKTLIRQLNNTPDNFNLDLDICLKAKKLNYEILRINLNFKDRVFESAKGGGTLYGKFKLSLSVFNYLLNKNLYH
jgi:glycosyltransferase involved in cell wall biosynthesis